MNIPHGVIYSYYMLYYDSLFLITSYYSQHKIIAFQNKVQNNPVVAQYLVVIIKTCWYLNSGIFRDNFSEISTVCSHRYPMAVISPGVNKLSRFLPHFIGISPVYHNWTLCIYYAVEHYSVWNLFTQKYMLLVATSIYPICMHSTF